MQPPSAVVFDLDGTLVDTSGDIVAATNHALEKTGRKPLSAQEIIRFVGDGAVALCARAARLPEISSETDELVAIFSAYYEKHPVVHSKWTAGAQEALDQLAGMRNMALAICTNKPRGATDAVLSGLGVRTRFRVVCAGGDTPERKPAPGPLYYVAAQLKLAPDAMVMVGDGPQDIECARRAGVRAVGVVGFAGRDRLLSADPDVTLDSLVGLADVIKRWVDATARISIPPR